MREREKKKSLSVYVQPSSDSKKSSSFLTGTVLGSSAGLWLSASTPKISSADPPKELLSLHPDSLLHEDVSPSWTSSSSQGKATWQPP